jgi:predicted ArsR family transcriptional regulator
VVGPEFTVVRIEHRLSGARRCVYKFEKSVQ